MATKLDREKLVTKLLEFETKVGPLADNFMEITDGKFLPEEDLEAINTEEFSQARLDFYGNFIEMIDHLERMVNLLRDDQKPSEE